MNLQNFSLIATVFSSIGVIVTAFVAWKQLSNLNKNLNDSNLMAIFEIEFELNRRKQRLSEIRKEGELVLLGFLNKECSESEKSLILLHEGHRKEAYEDYLNIFDRLCYFILKDKLKEEDFRIEYREMLFQTIDADKENTFATTTKYRNMIKLFNKWKDM